MHLVEGFIIGCKIHSLKFYLFTKLLICETISILHIATKECRVFEYQLWQSIWGGKIMQGLFGILCHKIYF